MNTLIRSSSSTVTGSGTAGSDTWAVVDQRSDNEDILVRVDPDELLTPDSARALAEIIAEAMNLMAFEHELTEE